MTYEMRIRDAQDKNLKFIDDLLKDYCDIAKNIGESEATFKNLKSLMKNSNCSIDKAMDLLSTPLQERQFYKDLLAKSC